jgi:hypothetical protein
MDEVRLFSRKNRFLARMGARAPIDLRSRLSGKEGGPGNTFLILTGRHDNHAVHLNQR